MVCQIREIYLNKSLLALILCMCISNFLLIFRLVHVIPWSNELYVRARCYPGLSNHFLENVKQ